MNALDPRDPVGVAEVLRGRAADRWGKVELAEVPSSIGAGFDSYIHLVHLSGADLPPEWAAPLVVRILPSPEREAQAHREAEAQMWSRSVGYDAPHILEVLDSGEGFGLPVQIMARAPGTTMLEAVLRQPWRVFRLVDRLAELQLALHGLPTATWPGTTDPRDLVDKRLGMPRRASRELADPALADALERVEAVIPEGIGGTLVVCHGDFHPLNVMIDGDQANVIDWSDAGLGPREADVARTLLLFQVASIAASSSIERIALQVVGPRMRGRYQRTYERSQSLDPRRLLVWEALHSLHGWSQVLTLHAGGFEGASSSAGDEARAPVAVGEWLRARFEQALADLAR